jgi:hypothetical protein
MDGTTSARRTKISNFASISPDETIRPQISGYFRPNKPALAATLLYYLKVIIFNTNKSVSRRIT